jgi:prepilin-type N-terminal cleavage/methylation domain-containing protein
MTFPLLPTARPGERGVTLLELLVALAILSLIAVAMAPLVTPSNRGAMIDVAARELALALRETRTAAIYGNKETTFTLDGPAGAYWSDAVPAHRPLPVKITARFARQAEFGQIQFYPDGGASGDTIVLRDARRSATIRVDALSGRAQFHVSP